MSISRSTAWLALSGVAAAASAAAPASAEGTARLSLNSNSPNNATFDYSDYAGPIAATVTNRDGKFSGSADYGRISASRSGKVTSLVDGRSTRSANGRAGWDDTFIFASSAGIVDAAFKIDVAAPNIQVSTAGYRTSSAQAGFGWNVNFATNGGALSGSAYGAKFYTDTPITAPVYGNTFDASSTGFDSSAIYGFGTRIKSLGFLRPGYETFLITATFKSGEYHLSVNAGCYNFQTSFRIGDASTANCGSGRLEWGGLAGVYDRYSGTALTASVGFDGFSGYDYTQPFTPAAVGAFTAASAAAVPEPASWTLLIAGFGLVGAAVRRRRGAAVRPA